MCIKISYNNYSVHLCQKLCFRDMIYYLCYIFNIPHIPNTLQMLFLRTVYLEITNFHYRPETTRSMCVCLFPSAVQVNVPASFSVTAEISRFVSLLSLDLETRSTWPKAEYLV